MLRGDFNRGFNPRWCVIDNKKYTVIRDSRNDKQIHLKVVFKSKASYMHTQGYRLETVQDIET